MLAEYQSPFDATVVRRLQEAGAEVVGKTNLDEFGMGSSTENSARGPTLNPHDRTKVPGGSSGGSAAAVAAGYVSLALGSDTGGSVRQPAAFCGVTGIKPTYGRVSRYGLVAFASSLEQIGTFGRTVSDAATLLDVVSGYDPRDSTSVDREVHSAALSADSGVEGRTIGVPVEFFPDTLDPAVRAVLESALAGLEAAGASLREVSLPSTTLAIPCYYVIATAEASSNLARFDGVRFGQRMDAGDVGEMIRRSRTDGFGEEVRRRIMLGTYVLSSGYYDQYYGAAQRARRAVVQDFRSVFASGVDALFTPTTPAPAFDLGERMTDPLQMYQSDVFTVTANLAGVPAMSVPIGTVRGLPFGGQVIGPWWGEASMVAVGGVLEAQSGGRAE
jgi:aspartyl-tRNA(Asn)/glutamyl-tRNA(Gln) amidotransferase subunit A